MKRKLKFCVPTVLKITSIIEEKLKQREGDDLPVQEVDKPIQALKIQNLLRRRNTKN